MTDWKRRALLRAGVAAATPFVAGCSSSTEEDDSSDLTTFEDTATPTEDEPEQTTPYIKNPSDNSFDIVNPRSEPLRFAFVRYPYSGFNYVFQVPPKTAKEVFVIDRYEDQDIAESRIEVRRFEYASDGLQPTPSGDVTATFDSFVTDQGEDTARRFVASVPNPTDIPSEEVERVKYRTRSEFVGGSAPSWTDDGLRLRGVEDGALKLDIPLRSRYPYWKSLHRSPAQLRAESLSAAGEFSVEFPRPKFDIEEINVPTAETDNGLEVGDVTLTVSAQSPVPAEGIRAFLIQREPILSGASNDMIAERANEPRVIAAVGGTVGNPSVVSPVTGQERIGQTAEITLPDVGSVSTPIPEDSTIRAVLTRYDTILGSTEFDLKERL